MVNAQIIIKNPFPGFEKNIFKPFDEELSDYFFGRDQDILAVLDALRRHHFVAVLSHPKAGKTSFLNAGITSNLKKKGLHARFGSDWKVVKIVNKGKLVNSLASAISAKGILFDNRVRPKFEDEVLKTFLDSDNGLVHVCEESELSFQKNLLLIIDDFSQCFDSRFTEQDRSRFFNLLVNASEAKHLAIYVLITLNKDDIRKKPYLKYPDLMAEIRKSQYPLHVLSESELSEAIRKPIMLKGATPDDPLVEKLIDDIVALEDQLPQLQERMHKTWMNWLSDVGNQKNRKVEFKHYMRGTGQKAVVDLRKKGASSKKQELKPSPKLEISPKNITEELALPTKQAPIKISGPINEELDNIFRDLTVPEQENTIKLFRTLAHRESGQDSNKIISTFSLSVIIGISENELKDLVSTFNKYISINQEKVSISDSEALENWEKLGEWINEEASNAEMYLSIAKAGYDYFVKDKGLELIWTKDQFEQAQKWRDQYKPHKEWAALYDPNVERTMNFLDMGLFELGLSSKPYLKNMNAHSTPSNSQIEESEELMNSTEKITTLNIPKAKQENQNSSKPKIRPRLVKKEEKVSKGLDSIQPDSTSSTKKKIIIKRKQ